jgi:hypothetical protein
LRFPDQRRQALLQIGSGCLVEAVIDLTRIDQVLALSATDIDAVPFVAVEREACDHQRLPLHGGFLHPVVAPARGVGAVAHFRDDVLA